MSGLPTVRSRGELRNLLRLVVITDERLAAAGSVEEVVEQAVSGGAMAVQLRNKTAPAEELLRSAAAMRRITDRYGALLFVNDRVDVALAAGADGVHLGPEDLPVGAVRALVPRPFLIGYSTDDPTLARQAEADGADYIGCGAVWPTRTKAVGDEAIGTERLAEVAAAVGIPVIAIGGVTLQRIGQLRGTGAAGAAVVSEVMASVAPADAARRLIEAVGAALQLAGGGADRAG